MSTVGLIVAFVVYAIIKSLENKSEEKSSNVPPLAGEPFPPLEYSIEAENPEQTSSLQEETVVKKKKPIRKSATANKSTKIPQHDYSDNTTIKKEKRITLRTTSEAKRAFIYSEIFNRKY